MFANALSCSLLRRALEASSDNVFSVIHLSLSQEISNNRLLGIGYRVLDCFANWASSAISYNTWIGDC